MTAAQFFVTAIPVFLAAVFAFATAFFMDWLKTRRENHKASRERQEKELTQLNVAATSTGYNIEALLHIVMQFILPHHEQSHTALARLRVAVNNGEEFRAFIETMDPEFAAMTTRCPEPYFIDLDFFKEIPFALAKDPELLKRSGWMVSYIRALKERLADRNKRIDMGASADIGHPHVLEEQIQVQANIGSSEIQHSLMLFEQLVIIRNKLKKISKGYSTKFGDRLTYRFPEPLADTMHQLRRIAEAELKEFPPPDPECSLTND